MGIPVLILGESGSGKSTSLRNFEPEEVGVFNVAGKPLPFRKKLAVCNLKQNGEAYGKILGALSKPKLKTYVIDDSQYLMAFEQIRRASEAGFGKYTEIGKNFSSLITYVTDCVPNDVIVYFLHHIDHSEDGRIKAKTVGKLIDNWLTLEGLFTIVLLAEAVDGKHTFRTKTNGFDTVKTPMDMFQEESIDNDLKAVDKAIREFYEM